MPERRLRSEQNAQRVPVRKTYKLYIGGGQPGDGAGQWTQFTVTGTAQDLPK